jgi:hypothetical protein
MENQTTETHNTGTINSSARYCLVKPGDKVRITFNKNVEFNEWIGRYACLCALTGEPVADIVMRSIKIDT